MVKLKFQQSLLLSKSYSCHLTLKTYILCTQSQNTKKNKTKQKVCIWTKFTALKSILKQELPDPKLHFRTVKYFKCYLTPFLILFKYTQKTHTLTARLCNVTCINLVLCWPVSAVTDLGAEIIIIFSNPDCLTCSSGSASVKVCYSDAWPASLVSLRKPRHKAKVNQQAVHCAIIQCPCCKHWRTSIPHHLMKIMKHLLKLQDA